MSFVQEQRFAVIGGGPMGLAVAYGLAKAGKRVDVFEKGEKIGGMSEHFDFSGLDIEKYYHFVCGPDYPLFDLMKELGIFDALKWTDTKMGLYYEGELYKWGGPFELLGFPRANIWRKARYGLHIFLASKFKNWPKLDDTSALDWIKKWEGEKGYQMFWDSLFRLKFYEIKDTIAAPWLWSRLVRVAKSRKSLFQERMGYISGGSRVVLDALSDKIIGLGGTIRTGAEVKRVNFSGGRVAGLYVNGENIDYDAVISTIPIQYIAKIAPELPKSDLEKLKTLDNVGVVCVITKLKAPITENFWLNITDKRMDVPGMIEISNLNTELKDNIVYVPFYLHKDNPKYSEPDEAFIEKVKAYFALINPDMTPDMIKDIRVFRYEYAQPVATRRFLDKLPPMASDERKGFYMADTAYCYPEDRSITESVRIAQKLCALALKESR